jgi:hypothetical protein
MPVLLGVVEIFGQQLEVQDLAVVALLVVLEGVLSIDNALVLGLLAKRLPKSEQSKALWYGLLGAFVFRFIAVFTASLLLKWTFVKFLGGAYLVYIAVRHLFFESKETEEEKVVLDEYGHLKLVEEDTGADLTSAQEELEIRERLPVLTPERAKTGPAFLADGLRLATTSCPFIRRRDCDGGSRAGAKVHPVGGDPCPRPMLMRLVAFHSFLTACGRNRVTAGRDWLRCSATGAST